MTLTASRVGLVVIESEEIDMWLLDTRQRSGGTLRSRVFADDRGQLHTLGLFHTHTCPRRLCRMLLIP